MLPAELGCDDVRGVGAAVFDAAMDCMDGVRDARRALRPH